MTESRRLIRLANRRGLILEADSAAAGRMFKSAFLETWGRVPLNDRRRLCAHWRSTNVPRVIVRQRIGEPEDGSEEPGGLCLLTDGVVTEIRFKTDTLAFSRKALLGLIAHELAHAYLAIDQPWYQEEYQPNALLVEWGLWPELDALALETRGVDRTVSEANRRKMVTTLQWV